MPLNRSINWLESTRRLLEAEVPETSECARYVTEKLSVLLLERLPRELAREVVELLPESDRFWGRCRHPDRSDTSIGFPTFVELVRHALGLTDLLDSPAYADSEERYALLCQQVADVFLLAVVREFPPDLKDRMLPHLPSDLRCRMDLYSGYTNEEKVA